MLKNCKSIALGILLFTVCFSWFFDGVPNNPYLSVLLIGISVLMGCVSNFKIRIKRPKLLLFLPGMYVSLLLNGASTGQLRHAVLFTLAVIFAATFEPDLSKLEGYLGILKKAGLFSTATILIHVLFKSTFEKVYFPLLSSSARDTAKLYARNYYFGVNYRPHIAAGLVAFVLMIYIISMFSEQRRWKLRHIMVVGVLAVTLLFTQKKGIIGLTVFVCIASYVIAFSPRERVVRFFKVFLAVAAALVILGAYITTHPNYPLFKRFITFFLKLSRGEDAGSGRGTLYAAAIELWKQNPLFGVGWKRFSSLTLGIYGSSAHQVNFDYLQFLCEEGLFGAVLTMIPIFVSLRKSIVLLRYTRRYGKSELPHGSLIRCAVFIQFFILLYAFIEDPFFDIMYFTVYLISCVTISEAYKDVVIRRDEEQPGQDEKAPDRF